jgi:hypothetical protein
LHSVRFKKGSTQQLFEEHAGGGQQGSMGTMLRTIIAFQDNVTEMVFQPEFAKLLNDANLMLDQIGVFKLRSLHGASGFTRRLLHLDPNLSPGMLCAVLRPTAE